MKKLITLVLLFSILSCGTQSVHYPVGTSDATIKLPINNKRIVVLNRVKLPYSVQRNEQIFQPNTTRALDGILNGFRKEVKNRKYFYNVANITDYLKTANGKYPAKLTPEELKGIARDADFVVSLEMFDQAIKDVYTVEIRRQPLGDKTYKEVDFFVGKRTIFFDVGWRLYNANSGVLVDEQTYQEDYFYESEALERIRSTQLLDANFDRELRNLGNRYGKRFAQRVSPTNHYTYREIYTAGNAYLEKGAIEVRSEDWSKAEKQWLRGIRSETKRKKLAKLYHNLAIANEKSGDLEQAKEYAQLAANQHPIGVKTQGIIGY